MTLGLSTGSLDSLSSPIQLTLCLRHQGEVPEARGQHPLSNVLLRVSLETKGSSAFWAELQGITTERLQGLSLRAVEPSKPWCHPGPHLSPGAARSWTCSTCAAMHLAWETAHIWEDQRASEGAPTPTNNPSKLENTTEPTPSGPCSWPSVTCLATVTVM